MTVSTVLTEATSLCNGVTTSFPVPFQYASPSDLIVKTLDGASTETVLVEGADYIRVGDGMAAPSSITTLRVFPTGVRLRRVRRTTRSQQMDLVPNVGAPAEAQERALDRVVLTQQEQDAMIADVAARGLLASPGETLAPLGPLATYRGKALSFDATGTPVPATIGTGDDPTLRPDLADPDIGGRLIGFSASDGVGRDVMGKLRETVSITDFGASTALADNTAAIQAAIDAVAAAGGGAVEVPLGKFDFATAINLKERVRLTGKGFGSRLHSTNATRLDGIRAFGPSTGNRMAGVAIDNLRLTSTFAANGEVGGNGISTGNAIAFKWVRDSTVNDVWTHGWSDSGVSLTDCTRVRGSNVNVREVSQGYDVFNDSLDCSLDGLVCDTVVTYVGLNVEGLAGGSAFRPVGFVATNIVVTNFVTHGINLVNAVRPVVTGWACSGGTGGVEGPGNGIEVYGCVNPVIGAGMASVNAGTGVVIGPSQNDSVLTGVRTVGNAGGGLLVTDNGGIGTALRTAVAGCAFSEGPPQMVGNVSILNVVQQQTIEAALPMHRMSTLAMGKRNAQFVFSSVMDADQLRAGVDITTNDGTQIFQVYLDSYGGQIFGADTGALTGGNDNFTALGRADQRFSTVFAGTGTINTSDVRTKQQIGAIPEAWLDAWGDVEWCRFKFNDAVAAKGDAARWHVGVIAQQVVEAFATRGLDATEIGLVCHDAWEAQAARPEERDPEGSVTVPAFHGREAGDLWSVRMNECLVMDAAWQRREIMRLSAAVSA